VLFAKRERKIQRILVVEDEPLVAFESEHVLGDAGYEVVATVDCVADAGRVIASEVLDLILTDMRLNGDGDGGDVARAAAERSIPVLFVTGNPVVEHRHLAVGCLTKPYNERTLKLSLEALDKLLQGKRPGKLPAGLSLFHDQQA
jgi:CheY-like chemotaxis protein